jgi:hypothetical protein
MWRKIVRERDSLTDRIAEIGNRLLNLGYVVSIPYEKARQKAISGDYEPETRRWIDAGTTDDGKIFVEIPYGDDIAEAAVKKLKTAFWVGRPYYFFTVHTEMYQEIEDFAQTLGYRISARAAELLRAEREKIESIEKSKIAAARTAEKKDGLKDILSSDSTILEDLRDEA